MAVYYINGTSNSGATFGQSGYFYPLYLTAAEANSASENISGTSHPHTFEEAPNITFYMPTTGAVEEAAVPPTGSYSSELYISYTSPIAEIDVEEIGTGVLASDTFNSWRKKTNDVARETIANKALIGSVDTRLTRLLSVTGGENNIMTLSSSDNITGEKEFEGLVKFTAADDLANAVQVGANGKLYVTNSKFFFDKDVDLHEAGAELKASNLDLPTGKTKYAGVQYTWPSQAPIPGQILKSAPGNTLTWATEAASEATVEAFLIEDPNPIGSVLQWTTETPPSKWLICDGSAVPRETTVDDQGNIIKGYPELFAEIGDYYGAGDGTTTFNLPDLRGRVPVGKGTNTDVRNLSAQFNVLGSSEYRANGQTFHGEYQHTLTDGESPSHQHFIATGGSTNTGELSATNTLEHYYNYQELGSIQPGNPNFEYALHGATDDPNLGLSSSFGGDESHNIVQPFIVLNYIIKAEGSTIVQQNVTPSNGILINGAAAQANLLGSGSVNTIELNVDSEDFEFDSETLALKLVDTNYRPGEVIETFGNVCGLIPARQVTTLSGTYSMPTLGNSAGNISERVPTNNGEIFGALPYTRVEGVRYITYEFVYTASALDGHHIWSHTPSIDTRDESDFYNENTDLPATNVSGFITLDNEQQNLSMNSSTNTQSYIHKYTIECVDNSNDQDTSAGKIYWPVGTTYQLGTRFRNEDNTDNEVALFGNFYNRDAGNASRFNPPNLYITATAG